ncbi:MAG: PmoA family protein [Verrucomicrobia bacterium]|nr:PmoA family protein [Verrucomicrobiota bacterium]
MIDRTNKTARTILLAASLCTTVLAQSDTDVLQLTIDGQDLVSYQAAPMSSPKGGARFKGSNFIHPLKTPSGFVVTDHQPTDHPHHFGLWWPWKYVVTEGRKVLCWELQKGDGIIEAQGGKQTNRGFTAKSIYIDRKASGGPTPLINELLNVTNSAIVDQPARGYFLDLDIAHEVAGRSPLEILKYRYSGFALRGTPKWHARNSTVLTSGGRDYTASNFTRARWVRVEGDAANGLTAGLIMMSHPGNHAHPERLRTWDPKTHHGAIFINFNPVQDQSWTFQPGKAYTRNYRLFVYDGKVSAEQAEALWKDYANH